MLASSSRSLRLILAAWRCMSAEAGPSRDRGDGTAGLREGVYGFLASLGITACRRRGLEA